MTYGLMIISDFEESSWAVMPLKYNAPLLVDPNAVKVFKIAWEFFKSITRRDSELVNFGRWVDLEKF